MWRITSKNHVCNNFDFIGIQIRFAASFPNKIWLRNRPAFNSKEKFDGYSVYSYSRIGSIELAFSVCCKVWRVLLWPPLLVPGWRLLILLAHYVFPGGGEFDSFFFRKSQNLHPMPDPSPLGLNNDMCVKLQKFSIHSTCKYLQHWSFPSYLWPLFQSESWC